MVCPWNRFAAEGDSAFADKEPPHSLTEELTLTPQAFNQRFKQTPIQRAKRRGYPCGQRLHDEPYGHQLETVHHLEQNEQGEDWRERGREIEHPGYFRTLNDTMYS